MDEKKSLFNNRKSHFPWAGYTDFIHSSTLTALSWSSIVMLWKSKKDTYIIIS